MRTLQVTFMLVVIGVLGIPSCAAAGTKPSTDRIELYAIALGRASVCDFDTTSEQKKVGRWINKMDKADKKMTIMIIIQGMPIAAKQQASGETGDTCEELKKEFRKVSWPG